MPPNVKNWAKLDESLRKIITPYLTSNYVLKTPARQETTGSPVGPPKKRQRTQKDTADHDDLIPFTQSVVGLARTTSGPVEPSKVSKLCLSASKSSVDASQRSVKQKSSILGFVADVVGVAALICSVEVLTCGMWLRVGVEVLMR